MNLFKPFIKKTGSASAGRKAAAAQFFRSPPAAFKPARVLSPSFSPSGYFFHTQDQRTRALSRKSKTSQQPRHISHIGKTNLGRAQAAPGTAGYFLPMPSLPCKYFTVTYQHVKPTPPIRPGVANAIAARLARATGAQPMVGAANTGQCREVQLFRGCWMQTIRLAQSRKDFRPQQGNHNGANAANHR